MDTHDIATRLSLLEEAKAQSEKHVSGIYKAIAKLRDEEIGPLLEFKAEMQGARRVYNLMWGVLCTAVVLDLTAQAFIYRQQTKNAEDIRGIQDTQQIILKLLQGDFRGK
jgi:hypothetical protein